MTSTAHRYSLANPPPTQGELDGRETTSEAEILEVQALQAERDGDGGRSIQLMERALQIRCHVVNQLREKWANAPESAAYAAAAANASHRMSTMTLGPMTKDDVLREYQAQCSDLYDAAERLVVCCNACGVESFKKDAFDAATPLFDYAMQLTEEEAYPLCEAEERRRHLRGVTLNNLGCMERRRGHFSEALNYMKASMEMTGVESPVAYMNMSAILIQLRLNDEAVRMAERSIALLSQTPEDPSLLAVAHHNLAMALEPVDPQRCMEEYEQAHRVACATLGKDSPTAQSIQQSWQRFERSRRPTPPPPNGRFAIPRGAAASNPRQRSLVGHPSGRTTSPVQQQQPPQQGGHAHAATSPPPADAAEIFPHPFLLTANAPQRRPHAPSQRPKVAAFPSRPAAPRYAPREPSPERAVHRPSPPAAARPSPKSSVRSGRSGESSTYTPSPPSQKPAGSSRRFSPARAAESSSSRPAASQRRLSEQNGSVKKPKSGSRLSPLKPTTTTRTTHAASTLDASGSQAKSSRVPRRPAERATKSVVPTPSPPPRVLPPLQTAEAESESSTSKAPPRPSRDTTARASTSQHLVPAAPTLDDNPLLFLQNRLDVLLQDEEELEQKYAHATTIQRHYRGHLARKHADELRAQRARDARLAELRRNIAARHIQHAYRNHRRHRRYPFSSGQTAHYAGGRRSAQHSAATKLQRIARGWLARRRYAKLRQYAHDSPIAAAQIQRWYRSMRARRQHAALLAEKAAQEAAMQEQEQQQYAATRIQGQWRAYSQRKAFETDLRNRMMARAAEDAQRRVRAAVSIQSAWRGSQARKLYRNAFSRSSQLRAARQEYERRRQAAVKLQSFGRMIIAKNDALPQLTAARLRAANEINTRSREGRAAQRIQCAYRSHAARCLYAEKKAARDAALVRGQVERQAITLQRVGRGYAARRSIGSELGALQSEAERYERQLRELEQRDAVAALNAHQRLQQLATVLGGAEGDARAALVLAEQRERRLLQHHCEIATQNVAAEVAERQALRQAAMPALDGFARIVKAKQQRAQRQSSRDAYLDQRAKEEEAAHKDASARVVTAFMRSAGARNFVKARASAVSDYNDARAEQEAAEADELSEPSDAELSAHANSPRELSTSEPQRPLTAQQIATERAELDRLAAREHTEVLNSGVLEAPAERPTSATEADLLAQQRAVWQAEEKANKQRREEQEALHQAMFAYKQERIAAAEAEKDLLPFTRERVRLQKRTTSDVAASAKRDTARAEAERAEAHAQNIYRQQRLEQERGAARTIEQYYSGYRARNHYAALQRVRDEYLSAQQDLERHEGPVLVSDRLSAVRALHPNMGTFQRKPISVASPASSKPDDAVSAATSEAKKPNEALDGFARIVKAKQQRAQRQSSRDAYLDQRAKEEEAAHEDASARVVTAFMRSAGARNFVKARASAVSDYNDSRAEQEAAEAGELSEPSDAELSAHADSPRELSTSEPQRPLTAQQIATERAELDRITAAVAPLLHDDADKQSQQNTRKVHFGELTPSLLERDGAYSSSDEDASSSGSSTPQQQPPPKREQRRPTSAEARECLRGFAQSVQDRKELRRRQASRDAYLSQQSDDTADVPEKEPEAKFLRSAEISSSFLDTDGIRNIYKAERKIYAAGILDGFARIVKAKQERAQRQSSRDAYLDQRAKEEEAAHEDASARVVTAFMRSAGARNFVKARASAVSDYNDARAEQEAAEADEARSPCRSSSAGRSMSEQKDDDIAAAKSEAARKIQNCFKSAQARQELSARRATLQNHLEEQMAVEDLLHNAALAIQSVYRGHRARKQAAMATVRRDLYLMTLQAETDAEGYEEPQESPFGDHGDVLTEEAVNRTDPFRELHEGEVTSTAVVVPVEESEEEL